MSKSIVKIFIDTLKKYSYILQRDYMEVMNILPHKRASFLSNGIKIFLRNVEEDTAMFDLTIVHHYETKPIDCFLDTTLSIELLIPIQRFSNREEPTHMKEYIVFNPIKSHIFYSDNKMIFYNDKKIIITPNTNNFRIRSINPLFIQNLYVCYLFLGCFKEVIIANKDGDANRFALSLCQFITSVNIQKTPDGFSITMHQ
jgi:hypothetical protein